MKNGSGPETPLSPENRPVAAVLFDLFHTLISLADLPTGASTSEILGIDPVVWSKKLMNDSPHHALGEVKDPYESIRIIAHSIDPTIPEGLIREACRERPSRFRAALLRIRPEILDGINRLRGLGLPIGLISNASYDEIDAWDESPLAPLFDTMIASCHERLMKPDPAIYRLAAQRLSVPMTNCIFVGDGGSREHEGANNVGMRTVLFLGFLNETSPAMAAARPRITDWVCDSFTEMVDIIERVFTCENNLGSR